MNLRTRPTIFFIFYGAIVNVLGYEMLPPAGPVTAHLVFKLFIIECTIITQAVADNENVVSQAPSNVNLMCVKRK